MNAKYVILVGDGMGDYPVPELGGRTPLEDARTPNMDRLVALGGAMGLARTIPAGMEPGSDVANMSLLGYDPKTYHTGRGPLEAASMGIRLAATEVAFRMNLVTIEEGAGGVPVMADYSAGHITTAEAREIVESLIPAAKGTPLRPYPGVSFRHLLVWEGGDPKLATTPPHDILGRPAEEYARVYETVPELSAFRERARRILLKHPVNMRRIGEGKRPATDVWPWGQGGAPSMPTLRERFGFTGAMISAVDLLKGIGVYAGLEPVAVPGATGYTDTNYAGKVAAALSALADGNFVFVHIEAPDECSHEGVLSKKMAAIEAFDEHVVGPLWAGLQKFPDVRLLLVTDHYTPISLRTHTSDPVPFLIVGEPGATPVKGEKFCERLAAARGLEFESGAALFARLAGGKR